MTQILIVEDNVALATNIVDYLTLTGIDCDYAKDGYQAVKLATLNHYDVIILDINLPKMDGLEVCRQIRKLGLDCPIIMLTARDTLKDKLEGFSVGTDDYLVKPFSLEELVARLNVLAKRKSGAVRKLTLGDVELDLDSKQVTRNQQLINLSPTSFKILEVLMRASPNIVSKQKLSYEIWGEDMPETNSLKVHIYTLRKQIEIEGSAKLIHTVSGHGVAIRV